MIISKANKDNGLHIFRLSINKNIPVIFPTDTIYGIGAPLSSIVANKKIYEIKKRPINMPFPILVGNITQLSDIADITNLTDEANEYIHNWRPATTLILKAKNNINGIYNKDNTIAVRIPKLDWLRETLIELGEPVTATSVNINKSPFAKNIQEALTIFGNNIQLFLWQNNILNKSSNIYDLTNGSIKKIR